MEKSVKMSLFFYIGTNLANIKVDLTTKFFAYNNPITDKLAPSNQHHKQQTG